jgi:hypothetical protein
VLILKKVKAVCFDALLQVLILKGVALHKNCAKCGRRGTAVGAVRRTAWRAGMAGRASPSAKPAAGRRKNLTDLTKNIIAYLYSLSITIISTLFAEG